MGLAGVQQGNIQFTWPRKNLVMLALLHVLCCITAASSVLKFVCSMIFKSDIKFGKNTHFYNVKSNILTNMSNYLRKTYWPLSPKYSCHQPLQATCHGQPPQPAQPTDPSSLPPLPSYGSSSAMMASHTLRGASAVLVFLKRLCLQ